MNEIEKDVPTGNYCYGYVPRKDTGFDAASQVYDHIEHTFHDFDTPEAVIAQDRLLERRYCKYWNPTKHGFVECLHLNRKALRIPTDQEIIDQAIAFFGSEAAMHEQICGFLLGDAVKECGLNRCGSDFEINSIFGH